jgi:TENA/THI-4/PQQC family
MPHAGELVTQIRSDLKPLDQRILNHVYLATLEAGAVRRTALGTFAGQQHHIITSDLRSIALLVSRHGAQPGGGFLLSTLQGEAAALDALHTFAGSLGMSIDDLEAFEPTPAGHAYCAFVACLALQGSDAELAGAFLVNFATWGTNCGRMRNALARHYGFAASQLAFFDLFANLPSLDDEARAVIQGGLDRGIPARLIHRAARMLQGYELMYWDAMAEAAGVQTGQRG